MSTKNCSAYAGTDHEYDRRDDRITERNEGFRHQFNFGVVFGGRYLHLHTIGLNFPDALDKRVVLTYGYKIAHLAEDTDTGGAKLRMLTWTPPGEIDGEPEEVRELVIQQLREFALVAAELVTDSHTQILAADLGELLEEDDDDGVARWRATPRGEAAAQLRLHTAGFIRSVKRLVRSLD